MKCSFADSDSMCARCIVGGHEVKVMAVNATKRAASGN